MKAPKAIRQPARRCVTRDSIGQTFVTARRPQLSLAFARTSRYGRLGPRRGGELTVWTVLTRKRRLGATYLYEDRESRSGSRVDVTPMSSPTQAATSRSLAGDGDGKLVSRRDGQD